MTGRPRTSTGGGDEAACGASCGRLQLASCRREIERAQRRVVGVMERRGYEPSACFAVRSALEEALSNAMEHGNGNDPDKTVRVAYEVGSGEVVVDVADRGLGFDPDSVPDPTRPENVDIPAGRGIVMMRAFMSEVRFVPPGNRVRLVYRRD